MIHSLVIITVVREHLFTTKNSTKHFQDYQGNLIFPLRDLWSSKGDKNIISITIAKVERDKYLVKVFCCSLKFKKILVLPDPATRTLHNKAEYQALKSKRGQFILCFSGQSRKH